MEFINLFKKILVENGSSAHSAGSGQASKPSTRLVLGKATVKNYIADVKKFVSWFEKNFERSFPPPALPLEVVEAYLAPIRAVAPRSAKRYESSLRKFFEFLAQNSTLSYNPLINRQGKISQTDPLYLKEFNNFLYTSNASPATIKNYIADVRQFLDWAKEVTLGGEFLQNQPQSSTQEDLFAKIDSYLLEEYKNRLLNEANFSPISVNRKLSSLKKYISWAHAKGYIKDDVELSRLQTDGTVPGESSSLDDQSALRALNNLDTGRASEGPAMTDTSDQSKSDYSRFGPLRLLQKSKRAVSFLFDSLVILSVIKTIEAIKYNLWKATGKQVFAQLPTVLKSLGQNAETAANIQTSVQIKSTPFSMLDRLIRMKNGHAASASATFDVETDLVRSIPKSVYAPLRISTDALSFRKKMMFHLKHTRPKWYKKYHSYAFAHYFHFALLLVFASFIGFNIYRYFNPPADSKLVLGSQVAPGRVISFQGRLQDAQDTPITKETTVKFGIYNSQTTQRLLWQENQTVKPDQTGSFTTTLGKINSIDQDIFNNNPNLYLGISIGEGPELSPRQELANAGLSKSAEELQGLKPITGNNAGTENVILALDSSGNLTIGGNSSPIFQATGGEFRLSGQQLTLATNEGTNTNIVLNPDGTGIIDLQKPLQNTSESNNPDSALSAVKIDDTLSILATSSAQSALVINQNGTGDLISAITGDTAKFTLSNNGSVRLAGDLSVLGNNLTTVTGTFNLANTNTLTLNIGGAATEISIGSKTGTTTINNSLKVNGVLTLPSLTSGSIPFINASNQLAQDNVSFFWDQGNKRLGLGTSSPGYKFSAIDSTSQSGGAVSTITNTHPTDTTGTNVLRLNTGVASTGSNARFITFYAGCTTENCIGTGVGNIHQTPGGITLQSGTADFAERFEVQEPTEAGDVIGIDAFGNRKAKVGNKILGVVSDSAIVIGNSPENVDKDKNPVVGLLGQVRTKVSTENGEIKKGDRLTVSSIPGVAKKATGEGEIIGTALSDYNQTGVGKILVLVRPGWHAPDINLGDSGALETQFGNNNQTPKTGASDPHDQSYEKLVLSVQEFVDTLQDGVLEVDKISTSSLSVATEDITIGAQTLREYISSIVNEILDERMAKEKQKTIVVVSPLADDTASESLNDELQAQLTPSPTLPLLTPTPIASQSATYITNIYNNASSSASVSEAAFDAAQTTSNSAGLTPTPSPFPTLIEPTPTATSSAEPTTNIEKVENVSKVSQVSKAFDTSGTFPPFDTLKSADIATFSAELSYIPNLKSDFAQFNQGLITLGPTSLAETSISTQLSIGQNLQINENSINTIASDLSLQPLRQGNLAIMGGLVSIDTQGNLTVEGNATFAKDVTVRGVLAAGIISPISESDLVIKLGGTTQNPTQNNAEQRSSELVVADQNGSNKLRINNLGDVISSGSAQFSNFKIVRGAQADTSFTETVASGSAGTATITANETERTIVTPYVSKDSLIYITPVSSTLGTTPYIARQAEENPTIGSKGSFTIQIHSAQPFDLKLNWIIVN